MAKIERILIVGGGIAGLTAAIALRQRLKGTPFAKLQALPKDAKPVVTWADHDSAFVDITDGLRNAIQDLVGAA